MDQLKKCRRLGCGKEYYEKDNVEGSCHYHDGKPMFHDTKKGWTCCNQVAYDWDEFQKLQPCKVGKHSDVPPEKIEFFKSDNLTKPRKKRRKKKQNLKEKNLKKLLKIQKGNIFVDTMDAKIKHMIRKKTKKEVAIIIWVNLCSMIEKNSGLVVKLKRMIGMILKNCHLAQSENMCLNINKFIYFIII